MRESGMPVRRCQPGGRSGHVLREDPDEHLLAVDGDDLHVAAGQRRGVPGPAGRGAGPRASCGEGGADAALREQAAVRGDDRPGDDQSAPGQPLVVAQEGPEGDVGGTGAAGPLHAARSDVAERVPAVVVVHEMGDDAARSTGSDDRFPADAVEAQGTVGPVVVADGADQLRVGGGRLQAVRDEEEFTQDGHRLGGVVHRVGAVGAGAAVRVARVAHVAYDVEGGALRTVQAGQPGRVRGPEQLGLRDRARGVDPGGQDRRGRRPQVPGGTDAAGGRAPLRGDTRRRAPSGRRPRGRGGRCGGRGGVRDRTGGQDRGAVQAARGEEAGAVCLVGGGDRAGRAGGEGHPRVLAAADAVRAVLGCVDGRAGERLHGRVESAAQPGGQALDRGGAHLRCDRGERGGGARAGRGHRAAPRTCSPTQRASASGLRAATGIPAATSCRAIGTE